MKLLKGFFKPLFIFDLRSLSLMRIGIAFTLLIDLFIRLSNLEAHYTDYGVLPLEALFRLSWNPYYFSLYTMSGSPFFQILMFFINLLCIIGLLIGFRTKLFTFLCWIFLISIHNRNPLIHQGGDDLLRLLLFLGIFLPWNYYYSIDAKKNSGNARVVSYFSLAGFSYMLQVGYVCFFSALLKSSAEWTSEYSAIYYALSIDQIVLPAGRLIYPFEELLKYLTMGVYYTELLLPMVLLIPFLTGYFRLIFILIMTTLHLGIALSLNVGLFPLIAIVSLIGLLPGRICERIANYFASFSFFKLQRVIEGFKYFQRPPSTYMAFVPSENIFQRGFILFFLIYIFNWNLNTVNAPNIISFIGAPVGYAFRVNQNWGMFSPGVFKDDGWFIFSATTRKNRKVDILQEGKEVTYHKLAAVSGPFKEDRWRKYSENILFASNSEFRLYYCSYLLNNWNKNQNSESEKINSLQIIYMKEISLPDYKIKGPSKEILCECIKR